MKFPKLQAIVQRQIRKLPNSAIKLMEKNIPADESVLKLKEDTLSRF